MALMLWLPVAYVASVGPVAYLSGRGWVPPAVVYFCRPAWKASKGSAVGQWSESYWSRWWANGFRERAAASDRRHADDAESTGE